MKPTLVARPGYFPYLQYYGLGSLTSTDRGNINARLEAFFRKTFVEALPNDAELDPLLRGLGDIRSEKSCFYLEHDSIRITFFKADYREQEQNGFIFGFYLSEVDSVSRNLKKPSKAFIDAATNYAFKIGRLNGLFELVELEDDMRINDYVLPAGGLCLYFECSPFKKNS